METASVIDNRMGSMLKFPLTFDSKEHLDSFLQLKIEESTKKDIISTYDNEFQGYHDVPSFPLLSDLPLLLNIDAGVGVNFVTVGPQRVVLRFRFPEGVMDWIVKSDVVDTFREPFPSTTPVFCS